MVNLASGGTVQGTPLGVNSAFSSARAEYPPGAAVASARSHATSTYGSQLQGLVNAYGTEPTDAAVLAAASIAYDKAGGYLLKQAIRAATGGGSVSAITGGIGARLGGALGTMLLPGVGTLVGTVVGRRLGNYAANLILQNGVTYVERALNSYVTQEVLTAENVLTMVDVLGAVGDFLNYGYLPPAVCDAGSYGVGCQNSCSAGCKQCGRISGGCEQLRRCCTFVPDCPCFKRRPDQPGCTASDYYEYHTANCCAGYC